jgi:hypothetical protein
MEVVGLRLMTLLELNPQKESIVKAISLILAVFLSEIGAGLVCAQDPIESEGTNRLKLDESQLDVNKNSDEFPLAQAPISPVIPPKMPEESPILKWMVRNWKYFLIPLIGFGILQGNARRMAKMRKPVKPEEMKPVISIPSMGKPVEPEEIKPVFSVLRSVFGSLVACAGFGLYLFGMMAQDQILLLFAGIGLGVVGFFIVGYRFFDRD